LVQHRDAKKPLVAAKIPYDIAENISSDLPLSIRILRALGKCELLEK